MANCESCRHHAAFSPVPAPLLQIRHGYRALWNDLAFSVESEAGDWTLRVQDSLRQTLYTARRGAARAAQIAAADFAIFRVLGAASRVSPGRLAQELKWQEYW